MATCTPEPRFVGGGRSAPRSLCGACERAAGRICVVGTPEAITATAHKRARIFCTVRRYGAYQKRSEEEFLIEHRKRLEKNLHRRAKEPGYVLRKIGRPEPQPEHPTEA